MASGTHRTLCDTAYTAGMKQKDRVVMSAVVTLATLGVAAGIAWWSRKQEEGQSFKGFVVDNILERPAGKSSFSDLAGGLENAGVYLNQRIEKAVDTPENREVLRHIIGIERWGQNRILVALKEHTFETDEYHGYRPDQENSILQLQQLMKDTRRRTTELAYQLHRTPPHEDDTVEHNSLGPLSAKGWLRYLTHHADLESRRLRSGREEVIPNNETASS